MKSYGIDQVTGITNEHAPVDWDPVVRKELDSDLKIDHGTSPSLEVDSGTMTSVGKLWRYFKTFKNLIIKPQIVDTMPIHLQLESTDACNLHCTSCSRDQFVKKPKLLSEILWKKVPS